MQTGNPINEDLVNEYINMLAKKYNEATLEVITLQARSSYVSKENDKLQKIIVDRNNEIEKYKKLLQEEKEKPPVEVIKEIIKEVEVIKETSFDGKLAKENEFLKKELTQTENKVKKLKDQLQEIRNGGDTEAEKIGNS